MSDHADQRDMTFEDVENLPPSAFRDILVTSFTLQQSVRSSGIADHVPVLVQYLHSPRQGPGARLACSIIRGQDGSPSAVAALTSLSEQLEDDPGLLPHVVHPIAGEGAGFLGLSMLYDGWVLPPSHPEDDRRDAADVPGSTPALLLRGITIDGAGFTVTRTNDGTLTARIELVSHDAPEDQLQLAMKRASSLIQDAYAYCAPDSAQHPPPYQPFPSTQDVEHEAAPSDDASAAPTDTEPDGLTHEQIDSIDDPALRGMIGDIITFEDEYDNECPWGAVPYLALRHVRHGDDNHACYTGMRLDNDGLAELADDIRNNRDLPPGYLEPAYEGFSLLYEGTFLPNGEVIPLSGISDRSEVRVVLGMTRDGVAFVVQRRRHGQPLTTIFDDINDAILRFGDTMHGVREVNAAFAAVPEDQEQQQGHTCAEPDDDDGPHETTVEDEERHDTVPETDPDYTELPPVLDSSGRHGVVTCRTRWSMGDGRVGKVYPPLPQTHHLAQRMCVCRQPLANGQPLQTYTLGPVDHQAFGAFLANQPHECVSVLTHQACVSLVEKRLSGLIDAMFGQLGNLGKRYG